MVTIITMVPFVTCTEILEQITEHTTQAAMNELLPQWQDARLREDRPHTHTSSSPSSIFGGPRQGDPQAGAPLGAALTRTSGSTVRES